MQRHARPARLTHAGLRLHHQAQKILNAKGDPETEMRHGGTSSIPLLRVGLQASIATTLTPGLVSLVQSRFGLRDLTLHAGQSGDHERLPRTKQADLALTSNPVLDLDGLERHPILTESVLLVLPPDNTGPDDSLDAIQSQLPLVRFCDTTYAGRLIMQHLRRLRFEPDRLIQADRSSMVTSCVSHGVGFSLLTPTLSIDGMAKNTAMRIPPWPVAGVSRTLTAVARAGELRDLPAEIARMAKQTLHARGSDYVGEQGLAALSGGPG